MPEPMKPRRVAYVAGVVAGLLASGIVSGAVAGPKPKDKGWPSHDDTAQAPTGCEYMGKGYMKAPGSDTCVRMSGYVRSDMSVFGR